MARHDELIVGLDVGTTKICAVVAEARGDEIDVIGIGTHPSRGLHKGVVIDIGSTVDSIRKAIDVPGSESCAPGLSSVRDAARATAPS